MGPSDIMLISTMTINHLYFYYDEHTRNKEKQAILGSLLYFKMTFS